MSNKKVGEGEITPIDIVAEFFEKYPWLGEKINPSKVEQIIFLKITTSLLLADSGYSRLIDGEGCSPPTLEKEIFLFSQEGRFLGQVGKTLLIHKKKWLGLFGNRGNVTEEILFSENVKSGISRVEKATGDTVYFIVGLLPDDRRNSRGKNLIFTAPQKGETLSEAFAKSAVKARAELEKKLQQFYGSAESNS